MIAVFMAFLSLPFLSQTLDFKSIFNKDYQNAVLFFRQNAELIINYSEKYGSDPGIIMSVLFPEAIRYSIVSDYLETKSLELTYVYSGTEDFSIGYFQMKPSFIEDIEIEIINNQKFLAKYNELLIKNKYSAIEIREERIERLKSIEYQIKYANCFYDIIEILYPQVTEFNIEDKVRYFSTAFNHGFKTGYHEIMEYSEKAFFPLKGKNNTSKFVYCDISLFFYENDLPLVLQSIE